MSSYFNLLVLGLILAVVADNLLLTFSATSSPTLEVQRPGAYLCIPLFVVVAIVVRSVSPHDSFPNSFNLNGIMSLFRIFFENRLLLLLICAAIVLMSISNLKRAVQKLVTLMIAAVLVIYIAPTAYTRLHPENRCSEGWRAMQVWAKANTPKDALFLTPPYMTGFRITWGGGGSVCYYYDSRTDQGVADDRGRFECLSKEFFETFPQLEGLRFSHRWSGIIASSTRFCMVPGTAYDRRVSWAVG